ncbi:Gfo/Idh/MocA family protein [Alicyclobacillus tolerans]|uniref:Gfo/Idh/MocA family protein n=1 Tax=Alicyclobacillus tolerans TaxID=90970 RepID=UPI003B799C9D
MSEGNALRVAMIGYQFMGKAHSHAFRDVSFYFPNLRPVTLQVLVGRQEERVRQAAAQYGFAEVASDWREIVERDDIDIVDIVTPNHLHREIAIAALRAGKHVLCEKPLALSLEEAVEMEMEAKKALGINMICHNYRFAPAVQLAKQWLQEGRLGKIYHIRAQYLQDWMISPDHPMEWRLQKQLAGSGALGDIGSHIIDLARFLVGEIDDVTAVMKTFIQERPFMVGNEQDVTGKVDVDDAAAFLAKFLDGALGVFEATRFATGNRNGNRFEINGEKGSLRWDLEDMNRLYAYFVDDPADCQGFRQIQCTESVHPYLQAYWPPGHIIGYEHTFINLFATFLMAIERREQGIDYRNLPSPNFTDGLYNQRVMAAVERSAENGKWEKVMGSAI